MIVDTHLHIIDLDALSYPWLADVEPLNRPSPYETYAREAKRCGITRTLHMEVDVAPDQIDAETDYVKAKASQEGSLLCGCIAACRPENEQGFAEAVERAKADPFIKGFRRILHVMPDDTSESPTFHANIARLSGSDLTFDLCALPRQVPQIAALVDGAPDVRFILDHCGVPDIKDGDFDSWAAGISDLAKRPNVTAKISGIMAYADAATWDLETLRPWAEHVIGAFGWDRVVWGSDYPVCTLGGALSQWVATTHAILEGCSADEKTALLSGNATRIWNL